MNTNESLQSRVVEALEFDPSVNAANIGVTVHDGIVTLKGFAASYAEKLSALRISERVLGVRAVVDQLEIELPDRSARSDEELAKAILNALEWDVVVPKNRIKVAVRNAQVTLEGHVDWQYQRNAAERAVRNLTGVRKVHNHLVIEHKPSTSGIKERIEQALKRSAELEANAINVETRGHTVALTGEVQSFAEREAAERAAWNAPGVTTVENELRVKF